MSNLMDPHRCTVSDVNLWFCVRRELSQAVATVTGHQDLSGSWSTRISPSCTSSLLTLSTRWISCMPTHSHKHVCELSSCFYAYTKLLHTKRKDVRDLSLKRHGWDAWESTNSCASCNSTCSQTWISIILRSPEVLNFAWNPGVCSPVHVGVMHFSVWADEARIYICVCASVLDTVHG